MQEKIKPWIVWQVHEANLSGANMAMLEYVNAMRDSYKFHVVLPHAGTMCAVLQERSIPFTVVHQYGWAGGKGNPMQQVRRFVRTYLALRAIKNLFRLLNPGFVFSNTLVPFVAAKAACACNIPHVWFIHEFGEEDFGFSIGFGKKEKAFQKMAKWSKLVVVNSNAVLQKFQPLLGGVQVERVYQPVSWKPLPIEREGGKQARFLMFGQLAAAKGHLDVIEAVVLARKKFYAANLSLHIIGPCEDKSYLNQLHERIKDNHLQDTVQVREGFFRKEEVMPFFEALIVASRSEAFGRVIIEAKKAGMDVIARNAGGVPELLTSPDDKAFKTIDQLAEILGAYVRSEIKSFLLPYNEKEEIAHLKNLLKSLQ
ncbi:MAG TPA: glycosyltransferase [Chitinophagaceae bacterium]|nr:glycosyltransferase [Chitinophagaceae bacterium]